jgi:hypothetical protein
MTQSLTVNPVLYIDILCLKSEVVLTIFMACLVLWSFMLRTSAPASDMYYKDRRTFNGSQRGPMLNNVQ